MTVGRKPKPSKLKERQGNPGKRALNKNEPNSGDFSGVKCPTHLSETGKHAWKKLREILGDDMKVLQRADSFALEMLASAYDEWRTLTKMINKQGLTIKRKDTHGHLVSKANPLLKQRNETNNKIIRLLSEFGLTPSSRSRLVSNEKNEDDAFMDWLKQNAQNGTT